jgi:protein tyrosine phosphatase (PTP) superfamily phosphohydrolase (DUF442 family)
MKARTLFDFLKLTFSRFLGRNLAGTRIEDIFNFLKISDSLATSGQPTEEQFAAIANTGYQTVVNLALPKSANALPNEKEIVESLGMEYIHIPVVWENPTRQNLADFFHTMKTYAGK